MSYRQCRSRSKHLVASALLLWAFPQLGDIDFEGVGLSYLMFSLEQARSYPNVIVLDACRDNPFGKSMGFRRKGRV